jgi:hypothetical protein
VEDRLTPDPGPTKEARLITQELLTELLDNRLGYAGYCLASDLKGRSDLNIPFDGLEMSDQAHALICALDAGMEHGTDDTAPYAALPQRDWFRLANALIAAIICRSIRTRGFAQMKLTNSEVLPDPCLLGKGVDMPLTLGAYLQALAEQLAGEIDIHNDHSTGEQIISYFDWAKEQAMGTTRKLAELEARADIAPSRAQIEQWEKEAVATLKQEFHDAFLASPQGVQAMEDMVRTVQMNEVTVEARRNVVRMAEMGLLNNKGEMLSIKREARTILLARFSAESNNQEDEWQRAYFERLMEHLKNSHTDACLAPPETASQFVRDVAGAINAEVESRVDRMVRTIESTAREAYAEETQRIVAKAEAKARQDAKAQADAAFQVTYDCDLKVNHSLSDISLENICREFRIQLESAKEHIRKECAEDTKTDLEAFRARVLSSSAAPPLPPPDNLVTEVASWAEAHGFKLITGENSDESDGGGKRQDLGGGRKRTRSGVVCSQSSSISSWGPLPSAPSTPTPSRKKLDELSFDNLKTPTSAHPKPPSSSLKMDIDKSDVQTLQGHMEEIFQHKEEAKQTVHASLHNPANQMAVSPPTVEAPMVAESVMSPRPRKSATPPPPPPSTSDPTLLAILATLECLSGEVKGLGSRLAAVEEGPVQEPRRRMKPSAAPSISMPPKPTNLTLDLKALSTKSKPAPLPKLQPSVAPEPSSLRVDDTDAFASYRDNYDDEFPDNLPAAPKPIPGKAAEWVEVKSRPNHK